MVNSWLLKMFLNIYPPYLGTGIRVRKISRDFKEAVVEMKLKWYNRNYVNTHFGGSIYSMVDPFYMLMLIGTLGKDYVVWDKSAVIEFVKPGRGTISAQFQITEEKLEEIREKTKTGEKYLPEFFIEVVDEKGDIVAKIKKVLYVKKKKT